MIYFLKYFKGIVYFLAMLMLFQSCVIYKSKPSTIEEASSKKDIHIKILTKDGEKYKVRWIEERDGNVYSITNTKKVYFEKKELVKFKYGLFNVENRGEYISGLEMNGKDTATILIPIEQIEAIKVKSKGGTIAFNILAASLGAFVIYVVIDIIISTRRYY